MKALRIAVVGTGSIARNYHLPSLARLEREGAVELTAAVDRDEDRARDVAARFGIRRCYVDYREMLERETPDAVWLLLPTAVMTEVAGYFLVRGVPAMIEKPPASSSAEARALLEIAQAHGTPHQVAFDRRYAPLLIRMRELLAEAGETTALSCQFYRYHRCEPGFAYATGLHGIDALRFLGDGEVCAVQTRLGRGGSALITLAYTNGAHAVMEMLPQVGVQSERYTAHAGDRTVMVDGVIGWLTRYPGFLRCYDAGHEALYIDNGAGGQPPEVVGGFYGESAHFLACLQRGEKPGPDLAASLRSLEIAEAVQQGVSATFAV
jgi:myo-inositol 2-dehydrogenase / D-chiro-inositol 1-dehydrogenase